MSRPDVLVVGGGVVGCAVAGHLARAGLAVRLLARDALAGGASGAAAGMLTPLAEAAGGGPLLRWGLHSLERLPALVDELRARCGVDPQLERSGVLRVAVGASDEEALRALVARHPGLDLRWLDADALRTARPGLAPTLRGALLSPREAHLQSPLLVRAYAEAAARLGARIGTGVPVTGLLREGGRVVGCATPAERIHAGAVVLCGGVSSPQLLTGEGEGATRPLPVAPVRGQIVRVDAPGAGGGPIVWGAHAYLVPKRDGSLVVGATEERAGFDRRVTAGGVRALLAAGEALWPGLVDAGFLGAWAGLRPTTPDRLPLIGPWPEAAGLVLATGHHRAGVQLSPATGEIVRDGLLGKGWAEPAFLPERLWAAEGGDGGAQSGS
ncbi:MAG: glycine oxidase ThiO [Myxococcota bacterium]|nr:glycine oxidase ThiO [Myxococcota bacterium]